MCVKSEKKGGVRRGGRGGRGGGKREGEGGLEEGLKMKKGSRHPSPLLQLQGHNQILLGTSKERRATHAGTQAKNLSISYSHFFPSPLTITSADGRRYSVVGHGCIR